MKCDHGIKLWTGVIRPIFKVDFTFSVRLLPLLLLIYLFRYHFFVGALVKEL